MNKILIIGGTGSLGYELTKRYIENNIIYNYSRDENKHWRMKLDFNNHKNLNFIIGDYNDTCTVINTLITIKPNVIILAAAMKHIDQCEFNTTQSLKNNLLGVKSVLDCIDTIQDVSFLKTVLFVSSDKATSPVNNYGMCKALAETLITERAFYKKQIKFLCVRYGNVLNSRGSIIPLLHLIGKDKNKPFFTLTSPEMSRFVMTLSDSVDLIDHAILNGKSGDIVIPKLTSMKVRDLIEIFSELYNKEVKIIGVRSGEKLLESLINVTQSQRIQINGTYLHIRSVLDNTQTNTDPEKIKDYNSNTCPINKNELKQLLLKLKLI